VNADDDQNPPSTPASTTTPHDALFRLTFERPEHTSGMLRALLPAELTARVDWSSLALVPGSFRDEELRDSETDVLFGAKLSDGREALFYLLVEHQSSVDPMMAWRLVRYAVRVLERWQREHPGARRLPAVFPFVVAHAERAWTSVTSLLELYDLDAEARDALAPWLLSQRYAFYDLSAVSSEVLRSRLAASALARATLFLLQRSRSAEDLLEELRQWASVLREVRAAPTGADDLVMLMVYTQLTAEVEPAALRGLLRDTVGAEEEETMSAAEKLLAQIGPAKWLQKGRDEGRVEERVEVLLRLLARRFGPLGPVVEQRVRTASVPEIDSFLDRVVDAATLDEVLGP
jgi:predicted transposase/invertase (TIGR01784 family)